MVQLKGYLSNNKDNLTRPHLLKKADSIVFVVDFVQNSDLSNPARNEVNGVALVSLLLTLNIFLTIF